MSKVIAIAFSDLHVHRFKNFNENERRLHNSLSVLEKISCAAQVHECPVLFCGDLLHSPKEVDNKTMSALLNTYYFWFEKKGIYFGAISGNHDMSERNSKDNPSPTWLDSFQHFTTFRKLDWKCMVLGNTQITGVPYLNNDNELVKLITSQEFDKGWPGVRILMLHTDMPGAKTPSGYELKEADNIPTDLDDVFASWDIVLVGHIHKPQQLSKKVVMLGSPIHQDRGDEGTEMGYWTIHYSEKHGISHKFHPFEEYPKFITLKKGEQAPDKYNFYVYPDEILVDEDIEMGEFNITNSRKKLAAQYCKVKGIKSKRKKGALINILNSIE